jgi:hypothetical protein
MRQIEYRYIDTQLSLTREKLRELGSQGWILCALYRERSPGYTHLFYREAPAEASEQVMVVEPVLEHFTELTRVVEGVTFSLERDPDGYVWAFPDGSWTDVYLMGHDMAKALRLLTLQSARLVAAWKSRRTEGGAGEAIAEHDTKDPVPA